MPVSRNKRKTPVAVKPQSSKARQAEPKKRCGLCGKTRKLMRTECCNQWICDDEDSYVLFSYARNSCARNHRRYTLCGFHNTEQHGGGWQQCKKCRNSFETEIYVYYGTNEFNFQKLADVPKFEPTHCSKCNRVIHLATEGYTMKGEKYECSDCFALLR